MIFVNIYRFFQKHKGLLYTLMVLSAAVFAFFGLKVRFEEDLSKLLPSSEKSESGLVFGNLKVKDKIFLQMTGAEPEVVEAWIKKWVGVSNLLSVRHALDRAGGSHRISRLHTTVDDDSAWSLFVVNRHEVRTQCLILQ